LLFVLHLEPDRDEGCINLLRVLESFANETFNTKHHTTYIRLALQMEDGGKFAGDAQSQNVNQYQQPMASHTCIRLTSESP